MPLCPCLCWQVGIPRPQQLGDVVVGDGHPFGGTGGARGVNEVGDVIRRGCRQRGAGLAVNSGVVDIDDQQVAPVQPRPQARGGDRGDRRGVLDHELDPRVGMGGVDRQVGCPGLEHRQYRDDRLGGTRRTAAPHTAPDPHLSSQQVRQPVRRLIDLAVGPRTLIAADRDRLGGARARVRRTAPGSTPASGAGWVSTARLHHPSSRACSSTSSTSIDDNDRVGSAVIATNTRRNRLR